MEYRVQFHKTIIDPQERAIRLAQAFALFEPRGKFDIGQVSPKMRLEQLEIAKKCSEGLTPEKEDEQFTSKGC